MKEKAIKPAIVVLVVFAALLAYATSHAVSPDPVAGIAALAPLTPTNTVEALPTRTLEATPTRTAEEMPTRTPVTTPGERFDPTFTSTPTPTDTPTPPTRPYLSQVAATVHTPAPLDAAPTSTQVLATQGTRLLIPQGTTAIWGGCASDGTCYPYNFYWAPTHEVVMQRGEGQDKVEHELCHAHQHWTINGGAPLDPSDYDLESWYGTREGRSFAAMTRGLDWPWSHSAMNGIEDFAWTCAYWYLEPGLLSSVSPARYRWAQQHLP